MSDEPDVLLTTSALSRRLGTSYETIRRWRNAGKIRPTLITPGGRPRWSWPPLGMEVSK